MTAPNLAEQTIVGRIGQASQLGMAAQARAIIRSAPLLAPTAGRLPMSVRITNAGALGWVADAEGYRYSSTHPFTGKPWPPIPEAWRALASNFCDVEAGAWDCAHLVWYSPVAKLGEHRDKTEARRLPIVTFSIGDEAVWVVREHEGGPRHRARLVSGDVVLLAGPTRSLLHAVEGLEPAGMFAPSPLDKPGRLAVSLRVAG